MPSLKEEALAYEQKQTKNIADLPEVSTSLELVTKTGVDRNAKEFSYKAIEINGEEYRVAGKIIGDLKAILEENPNLQKFKVKKQGIGLDTKYTVIPLS